MVRARKEQRRRVPLSQRRLAQPVLSRADLKDIRLLGCVAKHNLRSGLPGPDTTFHVQLSVQCQTIPATTDKLLSVKSTFTLTGHPSGIETEKLEIVCSFLILYELTSMDGLTNDNYDAFTKWIGLNNVWPYAREFIHETSTRMGLQPLKLPLYRPELPDAGIGLTSTL
jgi:hypothetical protein